MNKNESKVSFTELDLLDKQSRGLNSQGRMLLDFAWGRNLHGTSANAKTVSRLRAMFRNHLGIKSDPFDPKDAKWKPKFKVVDKRGAADERAKRDAVEHKTYSYEHRLMTLNKRTNPLRMNIPLMMKATTPLNT